MANRIILKKSSVQGKVPSSGDLEFGELAVNFADGRIYYKNSSNDIDFFSTGGSSTIATDDTPPTSPSAGTLWWDSASGDLFVYYDDGSSQQWVSAVSISDGADGADGEDGADGAPGADGSDGQDGEGVPQGGTTNQFLVKSSNDNYDTNWTSDLIANDITGLGDLTIDSISASGSLSVDGVTTLDNVIISEILTTNDDVNVAGDITANNVTVSGTLSAGTFNGTATDSEKLGGLNPSQYLRSDESDSLTGDFTISNDLTVNGTITGDGSGLTNLPGGSVVAFKTFMVDNNNVNNTTSPTVRSVFNTSPEINQGGFSVDSDDITVPEDGVYVVSFNCYFTSGSARTNVGVSVDINGTRQPERSASNYIRDSGGHNEASTHLHAFYSLSANDEISLRFFQLANGGTVTLDGSESSINVYKIG